jgi:hypothetical protein
MAGTPLLLRHESNVDVLRPRLFKGEPDEFATTLDVGQ